MSRKDKKAAEDLRITGIRVFVNEKDEPQAAYVHRSRKARRAQARLDNLNWRELSEEDKLNQ